MKTAVASRLAYAAAASAILLWAPVARPAPRVGLPGAVAIGALIGALVFLLLARRVPPPSRALVVAVPVVVLAAACEEIVWRFAVFGALRPSVGTPAALLASTVAFAAAHVGGGTPRIAAHLVTGAAFGGAYIVTNRLAAPIAAHVLYNLLVVAACAAWVEPPGAQPEPAR